MFLNEVFKDTVLVIALRVELNEKKNHYFPVFYDNKDRWLGALINVQKTTATSIMTFDFTNEKHTKIAEKSSLLDGTAWNKK